MRFEHYEVKRKLKIKALETLIKKSRQKDTAEGMQVNNLLQEMKERDPTKSLGVIKRRNRPNRG